jgi:hypothetical protein
MILRLPVWRTFAVLVLVAGAIVATDLALQKRVWDARGSLDYWVHWGLAEPQPGVEYFSPRFEELRLRFDLDQERNIPSWYSAALFLFAALLLVAAGNALRDRGRRFSAYLWYLLALVFVFLSLDDVAVLHELAGGDDSPGKTLNRVFGASDLFYFDWVLPAIFFSTAVSLVATPVLWRMPPGPRALLALGAAVFLAGALGLETLAGHKARDIGMETMDYHLVTAAEESAEFLGVIIGILAMMLYIRGLSAATEAERPEEATAPLPAPPPPAQGEERPPPIGATMKRWQRRAPGT